MKTGARESELSDGARKLVEAIQGTSYSSTLEAQHDLQAQREQLEWLAKISPQHEAELRRVLRQESEASAQREQLKWLAKFSPEHEAEFRRVLREESEAAGRNGPDCTAIDANVQEAC